MFGEKVLYEMELLDPVTRKLVEDAIAQGSPVPEVHSEVAGNVGELPWPVEVAWSDAKVAVVIDDNPSRDTFLGNAGWSVFRADVDLDVLVTALTSARPSGQDEGLV